MYPYNIAIHYHWHSPYLVIVYVFCLLILEIYRMSVSSTVDLMLEFSDVCNRFINA